MKEILFQYAQSNIWANKRIIDTILQLPEGTVDQKIESSFNTIKATVYHTWSAESIWLQRLQRAQEIIWEQTVFFGTFPEACKKWEAVSAGIATFIEQQDTDEDLKRTISFFDRSGSPHTSPVYHILQHILNHSTYHRGQLVTMLRQAGVTQIPDTDFIGFARMKL